MKLNRLLLIIVLVQAVILVGIVLHMVDTDRRLAMIMGTGGSLPLPDYSGNRNPQKVVVEVDGSWRVGGTYTVSWKSPYKTLHFVEIGNGVIGFMDVEVPAGYTSVKITLDKSKFGKDFKVTDRFEVTVTPKIMTTRTEQYDYTGTVWVKQEK